MATSINILKQYLYHVQFLLANAPLADNERVIMKGLQVRLEEQIREAEKPN
jgi:hypothetical protein